MEKNVLSYLLLLVLCSSAVIALSTQGGENQDYFPSQNTLFTNELNKDCTPSALTQPYGGAMSYDLDGDGNKEIIYIDDGSLLVRNYSKTTGIWSIPKSAFVSNSFRISNIEILDFDSDGITEIIVADAQTRKLRVFNYSNKTLFLESDNTFQGGSQEVIIKCPEANECLVSGRTNTTHVITLMDSSGEISNISSADTDGQQLVFPNHKVISYGDRELDGVSEYATVVYLKAGRASYIRFYQANTTHIRVNSTIIVAESDGDVNSGYLYTQFSNVLVREAAPQAGSETMYAHNIDNSDIQTRYGWIDAYETSTSLLTGYIDRYPLIDPTGRHVSNIFRNPINSGSGLTYCYVSFYTDNIGKESDLQMVCGDEYSVGITESYSTNLDMDWDDGFYPMSNSSLFSPTTTWTVHQEHPYYRNTAILNTYGVWAVDDGALRRVWTSPIGASTQWSVDDYDDDGYLDFIGVTEDAIWFCNDGEINERPVLEDYSFDPDITKPIRGNTTHPTSLFADITLSDDDIGDIVWAKMTVYAGTKHNRSLYNVKSASTEIEFTYFFENVFNVTMNSPIIMIEWNDSDSPNIIKSYNFTIPAVSSQGLVEYGDGSGFSGTPTLPDEPDDAPCIVDDDCDPGYFCSEGGCIENVDDGKNALTDAANTFADITGLSGGMIIILTIFILGFAFIT